MSHRLIIKEEARLDMLEAYLYYETQQYGLGESLLSEVQKRFTDLAEHPDYYSYIDSRKILRDVTLEKFPYVIVYDITGMKCYSICSASYAQTTKEIVR